MSVEDRAVRFNLFLFSQQPMNTGLPVSEHLQMAGVMAERASGRLPWMMP